MFFPESVIVIAKDAAKKFPSNIEGAVDLAEKQIRKLPDFEEMVDQLVRNTIQDLIYDLRHRSNTKTKNDAGYYTAEQKVSKTSEITDTIYNSVYSYCIGGTVLGEILGADLPTIADNERQIAAGHDFNASLCSKLSTLVPEDKKVREALPEQKLKKIFNSIYRKTQAEAA
jgi:hypothetical protein